MGARRRHHGVRARRGVRAAAAGGRPVLGTRRGPSPARPPRHPRRASRARRRRSGRRRRVAPAHHPRPITPARGPRRHRAVQYSTVQYCTVLVPYQRPGPCTSPIGRGSPGRRTNGRRRRPRHAARQAAWARDGRRTGPPSRACHPHRSWPSCGAGEACARAAPYAASAPPPRHAPNREGGRAPAPHATAPHSSVRRCGWAGGGGTLVPCSAVRGRSHRYGRVRCGREPRCQGTAPTRRWGGSRALPPPPRHAWNSFECASGRCVINNKWAGRFHGRSLP